MNNKRRQKIRDVVQKIEGLTSDLEHIKDEEDDTRANMPENLESSEQYEKSEQISDTIEDAITDIRDALNTISDNL